MTPFRIPRAVLVFGWCCFAAVVIGAMPCDCKAQGNSPAMPLATDLNALDDALDDGNVATLQTFDDVAACGTCCGPCCCCPLQVWANALFLTRSSRDAIIYPGPKGERREEELEFDYAWGPSVGITFCPSACDPYTRVGMEFFAIDGWDSTQQVAGNLSVQFPSLPYLPDLVVPGDPSSGFGVATFDYSSNLYNTELNIYRKSTNHCWLTTLMGFRWIEIGEQYTAIFETGATTPNFGIDVNNHLYGFQVGTLVNLQDCGPWRLDGWMKMGAYANSADQDTIEDFSSAGGQIISASARSANVAFAGDIGISVCRQVTEHLNFRFSYMGLWVEGIALAPEQLDNSNPSSSLATLDNGDGTFYHGGFIGGELLW